MRMEFVLIALLLVAACFGARRMKVSVNIEKADAEKASLKNRDDETYFKEEFQDKAVDLASRMIGQLNGASSSGIATLEWRRSVEGSACAIERELSVQDKSGVVTSGSELNVIKGKEYLEYCVMRFIRYQQMVHMHVEKVRDCIFDLQTLAQECSAWSSGKDQVIRETAARLCFQIENDTALFLDKTNALLVDADKDPVGIEEKHVTPKVVEFRKEFAELRSKIRTDLAAEAKKAIDNVKR